MVKKLVLFSSLMALGCALVPEAQAAKKISKNEMNGISEWGMLSVKRKAGKENPYKGRFSKARARYVKRRLFHVPNDEAGENQVLLPAHIFINGGNLAVPINPDSTASRD